MSLRIDFQMLYFRRFEKYLKKKVEIYTIRPLPFVGILKETGTDGNYFGFLVLEDGTELPHLSVIAIKEMKE